jgi:hypothetical protein
VQRKGSTSPSEHLFLVTERHDYSVYWRELIFTLIHLSVASSFVLFTHTHTHTHTHKTKKTADPLIELKYRLRMPNSFVWEPCLLATILLILTVFLTGMTGQRGSENPSYATTFSRRQKRYQKESVHREHFQVVGDLLPRNKCSIPSATAFYISPFFHQVQATFLIAFGWCPILI